MVAVPGQVTVAQQEVAVSVKLTEGTVDDIDVLIAEEPACQAQVRLLLQPRHNLQEVAPPEFIVADAPGPGPVDSVEDPLDDLRGRWGGAGASRGRDQQWRVGSGWQTSSPVLT